MRFPGGIEADDPAVFIDDLKASPDVNGGCCHHLPGFDQREFCRAAADIDIENALPGFAGDA